MSKLTLESIKTMYLQVTLAQNTTVLMQVTDSEHSAGDNTKRFLGEGTRLVSGDLIQALINSGPDACYMFMSQSAGEEVDWPEERIQDALSKLKENGAIVCTKETPYG